MKRIAITQRVVVEPRFGERRDCLDQRWSALFAPYALALLPVPNGLADVVGWAEDFGLDGLVLSGGNNLAHLDGAGDTAPERDRTEISLLRWAGDTHLPVLGVCRGMQMINHFLGGEIAPVEGHAGVRHIVHRLSPNGPEMEVNSYHDWAIPSVALGAGLLALAWDSAGYVEAVRHETLPWAGVMWHPERNGLGHGMDLAVELFGIEEKRG